MGLPRGSIGSRRSNAVFLLLLVLSSIVDNVEGQTVSWAKSYGGTSFENGYGVAVDSSGNTYVITRAH